MTIATAIAGPGGTRPCVASWSTCRRRGDGDQRPVIVCEELPENQGTSVTNLAEYRAAEVVARHFPALLDTDADHGQPVRWLECYPLQPGCPATCDEVT